MGSFEDLIHEFRLDEQKAKSTTLELRVAELERKLGDTRLVLRMLLERLEQQLGEDIDRDGKVG